MTPELACSLIKPGHNCWQSARADRAAFLVDAAAYYEVFAEVVEKAQNSILITAWDINGLIHLRRDRPKENLRQFFTRLLDSKPNLNIYILNWDFPLLYADTREVIPLFDEAWHRHPRLHFFWDDHHPIGSSHHQKVVVIDEQIAFVGGLDFTDERWDLPCHLANDRRRHGLQEPCYKPFHDVMMMTQGPIAETLSRLVRDRWARAEAKPPLILSKPSSVDLWPGSIQPALEKVIVAVARTLPVYGGKPEVREIQQLFIDSIQAAKHHIYIENQYFTSHLVAEAIAERLRHSDAPEIVLILPRGCTGWLEEASLGVLRTKVIQYLKSQDHYGRFHVYFPFIEGLQADDFIKVHSKIMIVDDDFVRIGSANICNRSMGLDSECDLAIEAMHERDQRPMAHFRERLLAEHLGSTPEKVAEVFEQTMSLAETIEQCGHKNRKLIDFEGEVSPILESVVPEALMIDPEQPIESNQLFALKSHSESNTGFIHSKMMMVISLGVFILGLATLWHFTPVREWMTPAKMAELGKTWGTSYWAPFIVVITYLVGSAVAFPHGLLTLATALIFSVWLAIGYALLGSVMSAIVFYEVGRHIGRQRVRDMAGPFLKKVNERLSHHGILAVMVIRLLPIAPFSVVNLVSGAFHIRRRDFILGTLFGLAPGTTLFCLAIHGFIHWRH